MTNEQSFENATGRAVTRRHFLEISTITALLASFPRPAVAETKDGIPYRPLGRTGVMCSAIGLGGWHIGMQSNEQDGITIVRTALDSGINFLDNCWDYNNGQSEIRMGKALRDGYRQKAFLMTKIDGRTKQAAAQQIDQSLQRLQTNHLDLLQFHEVIRMNDPERIFAPGGGMEAALEARKAGKLRFIGFTGHKSPDMHLKMLEIAKAHDFRFDTVQMPLNVLDAHYDSFQQEVLPVLVKEQIGVLGMKPIGNGLVLNSKTVSAVDCLRYALNLPTSVVITGCESLPILQQALDLVRSFKPLSEDEVTSLLGKTVQAAQNGRFEEYKTTHHFDGTYMNPQWLG